MVAMIGPGTPYITPDALVREPLGIGWSSLVERGASDNALAAVLIDICQQATAQVDAWCNQPLRATANVEELVGPGAGRLGIDPSTGVATCVMRRGPVLQVTDVRVAVMAHMPWSWTQVTPGQYAPASPIIGMYGTSSPSDSGEGGQAVVLAPGWVGWNHGRRGYRVKVGYLNGWPHTSLTSNATAGSTTLAVDDVTGWAPVFTGEPGAVGVIFDAAAQEAITVTAASAVSGPGTLTLSAPLTGNHNAGVMVTTMPAQIRWATALYAASQALTRGATTTTVHTTTPREVSSTGPEKLIALAQAELRAFRRVW